MKGSATEMTIFCVRITIMFLLCCVTMSVGSMCRVLEGFSDPVVSMDARYAWKYAASRGMTGTPQFLVNGVHVPTAADFSVTEWKMFLNELLNTPTWF